MFLAPKSNIFGNDSLKCFKEIFEAIERLFVKLDSLVIDLCMVIGDQLHKFCLLIEKNSTVLLQLLQYLISNIEFFKEVLLKFLFKVFKILRF